MRATVRVPASVANLGPGFDMLALALQPQNEVIATTTDGGAVSIEIEHVGSEPELLDPDTTWWRVPTSRAAGVSKCLTVSGAFTCAAPTRYRLPPGWDRARRRR